MRCFFRMQTRGELLRFFNGFQSQKYKRRPMDGNSMQLLSVSMRPLNEIKENEVVVRMLSPLIVRRHNSVDNSDIYYTCEMEEFGSVLKENIDIFFDKMGVDAPTEDFSIQVMKGKKVVVPLFGRNTDASIGIYKLTGSCRLLNTLYLSGIGARRSSGHGKFEVIG